jgi:hypothetical protein
MKLLREIIPTESQVLDAVLRRLRCDRRVAWDERFNSGVIMVGEGKTKRPFRANTLQGCPDILGQLCDGRTLAIECKRPGWKKPKDQREAQQAEFLALVETNGGVSGFVMSVDCIDKIVDSAFSASEAI